MVKKTPVERWRIAKRKFAVAPNPLHAVGLQKATRELRESLKDKLKVIEGGKS